MNDENLIRTAKVSAIDYATGMLSVVYNDKGRSVSAKMPYMNFNDEYYMPTIGSQVDVMLLSNGSSRGVVIGNKWEKANLPREKTGKGIYRKDFSKTPGACTAKYDDATGIYELQSGYIYIYAMAMLKLAGAEIYIDANSKITIDSPEMDFLVPLLNLKAEDEALEINNKDDITFNGEEKDITATVKNFDATTMEEYKLKTIQDYSLESMLTIALKATTMMNLESRMTMTLETKSNMQMKAEGPMLLDTKGAMVLMDSSHKTTLGDILDRLEALDGIPSPR